MNNKFPMRFKVSVPEIMIKSGVLLITLCVLFGLALSADSRGIRLIAGMVGLLLAIYHLNRIVALARIRDSVTLMNEELFCTLLLRKKCIPYSEIVSIKAGSSLLNGIHYKISTNKNDSLIITNVLVGHLSLYNQIVKILRERHK